MATPFMNIFVNEKVIQNNAEKTYFQRIYLIYHNDNHTGLEKLFPEDAVESGVLGIERGK